MLFKERDDAAATLEAKATELSHVVVEEVLHRDMEEGINFVPLEDEVLAVLNLAGQILAAPDRDIPGRLIVRAIAAVDQAQGAIDKMRDFSILEQAKQSRDPRDVRNRIIPDCEGVLRSAADEMAIIAAYMSAEGISRIERASQAISAQSKVQMDGLLAQSKSLIDAAEGRLMRFNQIIAASESALQRAVVTQQAATFEHQANEHEKAGRRWLAVTVLASASVIAFATYNYATTGRLGAPAVLPGQALLLVSSRVILLSVLLAATVWCGRIYRAHRHNYVVSKHRQNALQCFDAFIKSAAEPETKAAVLIQATTAIFSPQHSGFSTTEADPVLPASEIIRAMPAAK